MQKRKVYEINVLTTEQSGEAYSHLRACVSVKARVPYFEQTQTECLDWRRR